MEKCNVSFTLEEYMHLSVPTVEAATDKRAIFFILIFFLFSLLAPVFFLFFFLHIRVCLKQKTMMKLNYPYLFTLAAAL